MSFKPLSYPADGDISLEVRPRFQQEGPLGYPLNPDMNENGNQNDKDIDGL